MQKSYLNLHPWRMDAAQPSAWGIPEIHVLDSFIFLSTRHLAFTIVPVAVVVITSNFLFEIGYWTRSSVYFTDHITRVHLGINSHSPTPVASRIFL